jgi:hypothetical protein
VTDAPAQRTPDAPARPARRALPPDALGLGLRPAHYAAYAAQPPALGYLELITENFLGGAPGPGRHLERLATRYPVVLHGVTLNLLGHEPLDEAYLDAVAALADAVDAAFVTDHLCWTGAHGVVHHDLLPTPWTPTLADWAAERAAYVQARLGRPFGLENLSTYVTFADSTLTEWEFTTRVVEQAGCGLLLDINNVYVSAVNHGFDPRAYLDAIDYRRVLQVHLAGHTRQPDGLVVDTHDQPVCDEVWALYAHAWRRGGPFPTLLEWDAAIPPLHAAVAELRRAEEARA